MITKIVKFFLIINLQIFLKKCIYTKDEKAELLGKYIHY